MELRGHQVRPSCDEASAGTSSVKTGLGQKEGELGGGRKKSRFVIKRPEKARDLGGVVSWE